MAGGWSRLARYAPAAVLGRPLHGQERYQPFFIIGSGRSGTTLLRATLEAHPDVHIPPENLLGPAIRDWRRYSRLPWNVILRIVLGTFELHPFWDRWELPLAALFHEIDRWPHSRRNLAAVLDALYRAHLRVYKPAAIRWGDKTPPNTFALPALRSVFPDLRVIHMLRDGRDVVRSFMAFSTNSLPHFAREWLRSLRAAQAFGARYPAQYLEIRYENLVREPRATLETAALFLGLTFDDRMLRHHELGLRFGDVERYSHLQGVQGPITTSSIGRWRTAFDAAQVGELERLLGPTLAAMGYR
jgi:protein-tyrosine sulfotransferase